VAHSLRPLAKTADPADSTRTPSPVRIPPASLSAAAFEKLSTRVKDGTAALKDGGSVSLSAGMQRLGGKLLTCKGVCVDVPGRRVVDDLDYEFNRKDRIGIVGPNGAGKSTLIRALQGEIELAAGSIETGATVTFGHYDQRGLGDELPEDLRVLAFVQEAVATAPGGGASADADEKAAPSLLSRVLFPPRRGHERGAMLSGGERRRLQMLRVLAKQPNFLLLDEPTNDLDLDTISVLEDFLRDEYTGVLLVVSHDRYFLDKVVEHLFVLPGDGVGEVLDWQASFTEYVAYRELEQREEERQQQRQQRDAKPPPPPPPEAAFATSAVDAKASKPLSSFEQKQLARLEAEMESLTQQSAELQKKIDGFDAKRNGYSELTEWTTRLEALGEELGEVELKWLELEERADL